DLIIIIFIIRKTVKGLIIHYLYNTGTMPIAIPAGSDPTVTPPCAKSSTTSTKITFVLSRIGTYTLAPFGVTATDAGGPPTKTVASTVSVTVSITDKLLLPAFAIYALVPSGVMATL